MNVSKYVLLNGIIFKKIWSRQARENQNHVVKRMVSALHTVHREWWTLGPPTIYCDNQCDQQKASERTTANLWHYDLNLCDLWNENRIRYTLLDFS